MHLVLQPLGILLRVPDEAKPIAGVSRNEVHVQVVDGLPGYTSVILENVEPLGIGGLDNRFGDRRGTSRSLCHERGSSLKPETPTLVEDPFFLEEPEHPCRCL